MFRIVGLPLHIVSLDSYGSSASLIVNIPYLAPALSNPNLSFSLSEWYSVHSLLLHCPCAYFQGLMTEGCQFESYPASLTLPAESGPFQVKVTGNASESGELSILGIEGLWDQGSTG